MEPKCARCGTAQSELTPRTVTPEPTQENPHPEPVEVQKFALLDLQRNMYICYDCIDMYNALTPLADQYGGLEELPKARAEILSAIPKPEFGFFKLLLPGQVF